MNRSALNVVACPQCRGGLTLGDGTDDPVRAGTLFCPHCSREYPIEREIPRFVQAEDLSGLDRRFAHLYDWFSYVYALYSRVAFAFLGGEARNRREVLGRLEPKKGRVLEVSIGPGVNLPYLREMQGISEVYGLDISLGQLQRCQSLCRRRKWDVELFLGNAEQLPFKDDAFDVVFHIGGINFFDDKKAAINEMIRVARPGTHIVVVDETEKGAHSYEVTLPGFRRSFHSGREPVRPPVDLVPGEMEDVRLTDIWRGWFYCLEFRKPLRSPTGPLQ